MPSQVRIANIGALGRLRGELRQYQDEVGGALDAASVSARQVLGRIGNRVIYWQRQKDAWDAEARTRLSALQRCQSAGGDPPPDCRYPYEAWEQAARMAAQAEGNLREAQRQFDLLRQAAEQYDGERQKLEASLGQTVAAAQTTLARTAARARAVHAGTMPGPALASSGTIFAAGRAPAAPPAGSEPGVHAPNHRDGVGIEGEPAPEASEGPARRTLTPDGERERPRGPARDW
jgi:hypothetical protein